MAERGSILLVRLTHRYMAATVHALHHRGYRIRAIGTLDSTRFLSERDGIDTSPVRSGRRAPSWLPLPANTRMVLDAMDEDCVLIVTKRGRSSGGATFFSVWLAGRLRRVPLVFRTESDAYWDPTTASWRERLRVIAHRARRTLEHLIVRTPGYTPRRGPGTARLRPDLEYVTTPIRVELPRPTELPDLPLRVLTVTRCRPKKNNPGLLELAASLRDEPVEFRVIFSDDADCARCEGRGPEDFSTEVARLGLTSVVVSGPVGDVVPHYRQHHVVLRNSLREGANTTPMEGAAQGCIALVSESSGTAHGFIDPSMGAIVDAENVPAQAAFLRGLIEDVERRERMRATALRVARERCDPIHLIGMLEGQMR